jgi:hypothetical protein
MKSIQDGGVHHHNSFRLPDELAILQPGVGDIIILALRSNVQFFFDFRDRPFILLKKCENIEIIMLNIYIMIKHV